MRMFIFHGMEYILIWRVTNRHKITHHEIFVVVVAKGFIDITIEWRCLFNVHCAHIFFFPTQQNNSINKAWNYIDTVNIKVYAPPKWYYWGLKRIDIRLPTNQPINSMRQRKPKKTANHIGSKHRKGEREKWEKSKREVRRVNKIRRQQNWHSELSMAKHMLGFRNKHTHLHAHIHIHTSVQVIPCWRKPFRK